MRKFFGIATMCALLLSGMAASPRPAAAAAPDPVLQWINVMNGAALAGGTSPFATTRVAAMLSASVFDAVNGIDPRFHYLHVRPNAPRNASQRAAAIQAAYVILVDAYPAQNAVLTAQQNASLAAISHRKCALRRRWYRLGPNRRGRHLGLAPHRRQCASGPSLRRSPRHCRNACCRRLLASNSPTQCVRSWSSVRHHDSLDSATAEPVPFAASVRYQQRRICSGP
jgi:hypothetical protein